MFPPGIVHSLCTATRPIVKLQVSGMCSLSYLSHHYVYCTAPAAAKNGTTMHLTFLLEISSPLQQDELPPATKNLAVGHIIF